MERGQRSKLKLYDDSNLHWYQKVYLNIFCWKLNKRFRLFCKAYRAYKNGDIK